ncbi:MAG: hypothetical protein GEV13_00915 [Rhodospirillales bacterium]|nr:hypothetical protein [Rhodospirillales bacterium]
MSLRKDKLRKLIEMQGFTDELELVEAALSDAVCPTICMNPDCSYTEEMEPDQREGWCPECKTNSMMSGLVLAGII